MYCAQCGKELPASAVTCPACGSPSASVPRSGDTIDQVLNDTKRAAKELAEATAKLSRRLVEKAQTAAKEPRASAKKAAKRVAKELDSAAKEIDRILRDL